MRNGSELLIFKGFLEKSLGHKEHSEPLFIDQL